MTSHSRHTDRANSTDDLEDVFNTIKDGLAAGLRQSRVGHEISSGSQDLRIKCEYQGEKRIMQIARPVQYSLLVDKIKQYYGEELLINYTLASAEMFVPIKSQEALDSAVELIERNQRLQSLRLFLTKAQEPCAAPGKLAELFDGNASHGGKGAVRRERRGDRRTGRYSPPPGTLPSNEKHLVKRLSRLSTETQGEFIPEQLQKRNGQADHSASSSRSGSQSSLDSSYCSAQRSHGSTRSIPSTNSRDHADDEKRGGTFPRRGAPSGSYCQLNNQGSQSFPRHLHKGDLSVHQQLSSVSSDLSVSTSSSSSGLGAIDIDSPDGRRHFDQLSCSLKHLSAHKSPRAPIDWKKGRMLGAGAFGQVFLCYDADSGLELAVKQVVINNVDKEISKEVRSLKCEIQLLKNLHHVRIVQYFGCQETGTFLNIFMEYMAGGSVKDHINTYGALRENVTRKYTRQVVEGLIYLHDLMIVHRDIKGANILRDSNGNVKLGDFGASKRLQTICTATGTMTQASTITGTPYWMSPDVINGEGYGRKADIWSLGCTVVEMLTSTPPWIEFEAMAAIFKIATSDYPKYELAVETSDVAKNFLKKCFHKSPTSRPSAKELLQHRFVNEFT
ncbi:hypothetical protein NP493_78g03005 [Ridgeia piscesae]|uniref:Protein kinase domain-containing protein n=1 Tax=Ridgeia piscesae TaxID=27915 RepID=A0AAD9UI79_RIDPI|nr:hypothetical protein NP493_78g03005 [Ridgeia piscesae]